MSSTGWLAVKGKDADTVLAELDLLRTDDTGTHARRGLCIELPSGWFVVVSGYGTPLLAEDALLPLSRGCRVVTSGASTVVMASEATCYEDGARLWHVEHDAQLDEERHLTAWGELPKTFGALLTRTEAEQDVTDAEGDGVDCFYNLPIELAQLATTFDVDLAASAYGDARFTGWRLAEDITPRPLPKVSKPWWKFWSIS